MSISCEFKCEAVKFSISGCIAAEWLAVHQDTMTEQAVQLEYSERRRRSSVGIIREYFVIAGFKCGKPSTTGYSTALKRAVISLSEHT